MQKHERPAGSGLVATQWEVEKLFAGATGSGEGDSGVGKKVMGMFLTWMAEKSSQVYVAATANNVSFLPPELLRKGRFDEIFFVDLPHKVEREAIFRVHLEKRKRDSSKFDVESLATITGKFSGAEIEAAVESAMFDAFADNRREVTTEDIGNTVRGAVPLATTMSEQLAGVREWAVGRARNASEPAKKGEEDDRFAELDVDPDTN